MERWAGCLAVVTGASAGIGASICRKFVQHGINVVGLARRLPEMQTLELEMAKAPGKFYPKMCDLASENDVISVFKCIEKKLGGISIMINNAGFLASTTLIDGDMALWRSTFDVNVLGLSLCTRQAIASMKQHKIDGHIVNINSIVGHSVPVLPQPILNVYPASKHAVTALSEVLRQELNSAGLKIKISSISPGKVQTEFFDKLADIVAANTFSASPSLNSEDIAEACQYILSQPDHVQIRDIVIKAQGEMF